MRVGYIPPSSGSTAARKATRTVVEPAREHDGAAPDDDRGRLAGPPVRRDLAHVPAVRGQRDRHREPDHGPFPFRVGLRRRRRTGFKGVEFLFPYEHPAQEIRRRLDDNGLVQALFNAPPGDWAAGERGLASLPGREDEFRRSIATALDYARVIGNKTLHVMAGLSVAGVERGRQRAVYVKNVAYAADQAAGLGVTVVLEPINTRDIPGFFLNRQDDARRRSAPNSASRISRSSSTVTTARSSRAISPPGSGATSATSAISRWRACRKGMSRTPARSVIPYLFAPTEELGYSGWIGCEYRPAGATSAGLGWFAPRRPAA